MEYKKILIATDQSACSLHAAKHGFALAKKLSAKVVLISVLDIKASIFAASSSDILGANADISLSSEPLIDQLLQQARLSMKAIIDQYADHLDVEELLPLGVPFEEILTAANDTEADLIVMGTHGRTALAHLFLGSVAEQVLRRSKLPVLVVPFDKKTA